MSLRILLSFLLFIKLGVFSLTINTSPKPNPFTVDLDKIVEKGKHNKRSPQNAIILPTPSKFSNRNPELTERDLRQALLCSKKTTDGLEICKSKRISDLDNASISSASTFNYEFEIPKGAEKESLKFKNNKELNKGNDENISEMLEEAINNMDNQRRSTLDELERIKKPRKLPREMNDDDREKARNKNSNEVPFLTGIKLIDEIISPKKRASFSQDEEEESQERTPKISPIPKSDSKNLPKPSKDTNEEVSQTTDGRIPSTPTAKIVPPKPAARRIFQASGAQGITQPTTSRRNVNKSLEEKQDNKKKTAEKEKKNRKLKIKNVFGPNIFKLFKKKEEQKPARKIIISRPILQTLTEETDDEQIKGAGATDRTRTISNTGGKTLNSFKGEESDEEKKTRQDPFRRSKSQLSNVMETEEENQMVKNIKKRKSPSLKSLDSAQKQDSEQESDRVTPRPQSSQSEARRRENASESERRSLSPASRSVSRISIPESIPSVGSDNVFFDSDDPSNSLIIDLKDDILPEIEHKKKYSQEFRDSADIDPFSDSEFSNSYPSVSFQDNLQGVSTGLAEQQNKRVYEKFVPGRGFDKILQKKLINTYDSGDEFVENSVFSRMKNKVMRRHNEDKRKKERSKGIPSRVITKEDAKKFGSSIQRESQVVNPFEISPGISDIVGENSGSMILSETAGSSSKNSEAKAESIEPVNNGEEVDRDSIRKMIDKYRDLEMKKSDIESDSESSNGFDMGNQLVPIQNPLEVITYNDELKELKYARDDFFRNKFLQGLAEEAKKEESDKLSSQIAEKEALLQELEKISLELDKKRNQLNEEEEPINEGSRSEYQEMGTDEPENSVEPEETDKKNASTEMDTMKYEEPIYPEGSLKLDEDAVILGAERKESNKGIVVLDPENANYEIYFDNKTGQEEDGLVPSMEYYNEEEGLMPIQQSDKLADSEGLAPVGGFSKIQELQAFEENDRSLLPPPEESNIPFEEIYLTKHPELLNTDTVGNVSREKAIKKAFGKKQTKGGVLRKREFENFDLSNDAIERLKRNPFKTPEEKERIFRIIRAKEELNNLRKEEKKKKEAKKQNIEFEESSIEASELYPVESTKNTQKPTINRVSDESLMAGDFEEASEESETLGIKEPMKMVVGKKVDFSESTDASASNGEESEFAVEVGLARLNAIKAAERKENREKQARSGHIHYAPYVPRRAESATNKSVVAR
ncbi:signal peptide containing protein [Cryptosporidium sp. 43IA8]|nr:signal peptide containing protein [Cryptosporidium sp. 43IA8]